MHTDDIKATPDEHADESTDRSADSGRQSN